jgi:hypothetical protein
VLGIVMAPVSVRVKVLLTVIVPEEVLNAIDAQAAFAVTVTVMPLFMVTTSPATGTEAPPHVAVAFQLPVTDAVLFAAHTL